MVPLIVFYAHTVAAATAFTKRWQETGWGEGILAIGFVALIFSIGWSISTVIARAIMDPPGFGKWFDRDAFALALLLVVEAILYYTLAVRKKRRKRKEAEA